MGSFSMTCSVSGLGISVGTPVRCLLLTASPYGDSDDPRKAWSVRTPPIRAVYNDYGSIEDPHAEDDFIVRLWLRGLREDVVEKGLGDNSVHDVPVARDMSLADMLVAIQEHRLEVVQDVQHFWRLPHRGPGSDEASISPLMRRVEALLEARVPGRVSRSAAKDKYVVDEPVPHMARVRYGSYQHGAECTAALEVARVVVEATHGELFGDPSLTGVLVAGSGRYARDADLLVFPLPALTDAHVAGPQWDMTSDNKTLRVGLAMIREDVWQALIGYPHCDYLSLDCVECGQSPSYHEGAQFCCPTKAANGKPYKDHAQDTKYTHGPVFPVGVPHVVELREWGEYVWYGIDAYKAGLRSAWATALEKFARLDEIHTQTEAPATTTILEGPADGDLVLSKWTQEARGADKQEKERIAALPPEERAFIEAAQKARREAWYIEDRRKREHPFFGDFLIRDVIASDFRLLGAWFHDSVPGVIGVSEHFSMLKADKIEALTTLLDAVAELAAVQRVLSSIGIVLRPSVSSGPQSPEWGESTRFACSVQRIARAAAEEAQEPQAPTSLDAVHKFLALAAVTSKAKLS